MLSRLNQGMTLLLIAFALLAFVGLNNLLSGSFRLDLTDAGLYTLADGTEEILENLEEPVTLHFFFSDKASEDATALRAYASRVQSMLEEYERLADGQIDLRITDPVPFSEEEDRATAFGLQSVPIGQSGEAVYLGLAGTNAVDQREVIPFFQPERERFLEYELSKLVATLGGPSKPKLGIYAELPVTGGAIDPTTFQPLPAWVLVDQLKELFEVETIESIDMDILDYDLLLLIHPKTLFDDKAEDEASNEGNEGDEGDEGEEGEEGDDSDASAEGEKRNMGEQALFALDQFLMNGGRLIAFVDPYAESDREDPNKEEEEESDEPPPGPRVVSSDLNKLTERLGVKLREGEVLGDGDAALTVNTTDGRSMRHIGMLGFKKRHLAADDLVTAQLETLNFSSTGIFDIEEKEDITVQSLVYSSEFAMPLQADQVRFVRDPTTLQAGFRPTGEIYPVAIRLSGRAETAFPDGIEGFDGDVLEGTDSLNLVLVADTDVLTDRLWAQVQVFFGQRVATPFAENNSFITNLVENLSGSNALINVRSRGQFSRPFTVVETLRREAEASYQESEAALQQQLNETQRQLNELQSVRVENGRLTLTAEQARALRDFQQQKVRIRKELRDVRHQLNEDIESLGTQIKFINIVLMPLLLTGLLLAWRLLRLGRKRKEKQA